MVAGSLLAEDELAAADVVEALLEALLGELVEELLEELLPHAATPADNAMTVAATPSRE